MANPLDDLLVQYLSLGVASITIVEQMRGASPKARRLLIRELRNCDARRSELLDQMEALDVRAMVAKE